MSAPYLRSYDVRYLDSAGNRWTYRVMARDNSHALMTARELQPDISKVVGCAPTDEWS